jgi:hypothetical protein
MNVAQLKITMALALAIVLLGSTVKAQSNSERAHTSTSAQNVSTLLASLPEADAIIYSSPQRILNEVAPRVVPADELAKWRATFADIKRSVGIDPSTIDYIAIALRFHKPASDLSFVPPDVMLVAGGDFSSDSLITLIELSLQESARKEKHGSKTITVAKIDPIAEQAKTTPLLKSFSELGVVALNSNTLAIGNLNYLKAAIDAGDGNGRINSSAISSLLRDPNALISASGSPLNAFVKSFGMLGTETTPRESRCDTRFGDFYGAITLNGANFSLRGAMNADNPDTAKIINGLFSGLWQQAITAIPDKNAQGVLKNIRIVPKESEIVFEADVPEQTVASYIKEAMTPTKKEAAATPAKPVSKPKRRVRRK